jgi:hypothetical protein
MSEPAQPANDAEPAPYLDTFKELLADPEIAALLDFEPVPRKREVEGAWTTELQREFLMRLAVTGSIGRAAEEMGKTDSGVRKLYRSPDATSFRAAWDGLVELNRRRRSEARAKDKAVVHGTRPPSVDNRRKDPSPQPLSRQGGEGEVLNEFGEWEDEASYARRGEEAFDSIAQKLLRCRRLFLVSVAECPGKRAAFEMLTELPIDWDKAANMEPQDDEPWRKPNMREPDMVLTAESGWLFGEGGYGPDKKRELGETINDWRVEHGKEPIDWNESADSPEPSP